jgi:hypothetical protein
MRRLGLCCLLVTACSSDDNASSEPDQYGTCPQMEADLINLELKKQLEGSNGTFVDECDADGNLIEYTCGTNYIDDGHGGTVGVYNGEVEPTLMPCGGTCVDGRCPSQCPASPATMTCIAMREGQTIVLQDDATGLSYECEPAGPCFAGYRVGSTVEVTSGWGTHRLCTEALPGLARTADSCAYACVRI